MVSLITFVVGDREFAIEFGRVAQIIDAGTEGSRNATRQVSPDGSADVGSPMFFDLCEMLGVTSGRVSGTPGIMLVTRGLRHNIAFEADRIIELLFLSEQELQAAEFSSGNMMHRVPVIRITFPSGRELLFFDPDALTGDVGVQPTRIFPDPHPTPRK